jgi:hypothetical protein
MNKFLCGFYNMTQQSGVSNGSLKRCENQCSGCSKDQEIIDLKKQIKENDRLNKGRLPRSNETNTFR